MKTMTRDLCPHRLSRDPEDCYSCARDELLEDLPDVDAAVTAERSSAVRDVRVKGGSPNWGLIDEQAVSFTQDVVREGNEFLGRSRHLDAAADVITAVHQLVEIDDEHTHAAGRLLLKWRDRCRTVTGASDRPYLLTHTRKVTASCVVDGQVKLFPRIVAVPTLCPVVDPKDERPCRGHLKVHPTNHNLTDSSDIAAGAIVCTRNRLHAWSSKQGWLRLHVLLSQAS